MKCQDPWWTERGESDVLVGIWWSRTKAGVSKVIRYRSSSSSKRCRHVHWQQWTGRNLRVRALGIVCSQEWKLKKLTELHHKEWIVRLNLTQREETYQGQVLCRNEQHRSGAWSLEIDGMTLSLNAWMSEIFRHVPTEQEGRGYNRSEMPLDALGCTRNTIAQKRIDWNVFWWIMCCKADMKEEFLVSMYQQWVLNKSL